MRGCARVFFFLSVQYLCFSFDTNRLLKFCEWNNTEVLQLLLYFTFYAISIIVTGSVICWLNKIVNGNSITLEFFNPNQREQNERFESCWLVRWTSWHVYICIRNFLRQKYIFGRILKPASSTSCTYAIITTKEGKEKYHWPFMCSRTLAFFASFCSVTDPPPPPFKLRVWLYSHWIWFFHVNFIFVLHIPWDSPFKKQPISIQGL